MLGLVGSVLVLGLVMTPELLLEEGGRLLIEMGASNPESREVEEAGQLELVSGLDETAVPGLEGPDVWG